MANHTNDDGEIDMEAERRLQGLLIGLKQQADQLMMTEKFDDAIRLYRGLLVHLTKSQVKMAVQKDLVISCRMNVLGAMSKLEQWRDVPAECEHVFAFLQEIKDDLQKTMSEEEFGSMQAAILGRVFYFRGSALLRLGGFQQADHDFQVAMRMLPNVEAIKEDWKQVQGALMMENGIKELMNTAMGHFQSNNFSVAAQTCEAALVEARKLEKHDLTALIHGNLASVYARAEKDDDALTNYLTAIDINKKLGAESLNDRQFDLMEAATAIYMKKDDISTAYKVLSEAATLFPKCSERKDREAQLFINLGRVCIALNKLDEAEKHFVRAEKATSGSDVDATLHALSGLGKVYVEQQEFDKLSALLDRAFPITLMEKKDDMHVSFLLLWLPLLEERAMKSEPLIDSELVKLLDAYRFFGSKRLLNGLLRSALLLVVNYKDQDQYRAQRDEVLGGIDAVKVEGLVGGEADLLSKLGMIRTDIATSHGDVAGGFAALKHALTCIKKDASTRDFREGLLRRYAFLYVVSKSNGVGNTDDDEETLELLDESIGLLRGGDENANVNVAILCSVLVRVAQWEAHKPRGSVARAETMLQESVDLLKSHAGQDGEQLLCQALVGQCVLQIKQGNMDRAQELMREIESYPATASWTQLEAIKAQLPAAPAATEEATPAKKPEVKPAPKKDTAKTKVSTKKNTKAKVSTSTEKTDAKPVSSAPVEPTPREEPAAATQVAVASSPLAAWWDEYWFAVSVTIVAILFALVMMQEEPAKNV